MLRTPPQRTAPADRSGHQACDTATGTGVADALDQLVDGLVAAARVDAPNARQVLAGAAQRLRVATQAELETATAQWRSSLRQVAAREGVAASDYVQRALALPPVPGLADGISQGVLDGDLKLLAGWRPGAPLGPLAVRATHTAITTAVTQAGQQGRAGLLGLLPASGVVGDLAAGPTKLTGGFLVDDDRAGATGRLGFTSGVVTAGAFGRLAHGPEGVSFIAVLGARILPGIQLGFGFELSGVGGAVGVNVGVDVDLLRARLRDGSALGVFFPADPGARDQLLPLVRDTFPPRSGSVVVGPSVEITWLQVASHTLLRLSLVLLLELPRARVLVLGRGAVTVPPMVSFQLDALGEIDVPRGFYAADLVIVDGRVMGIFKAAGTAAMRLSTTRPSYALLTVGGFYPGYRVEVPGLPAQQRVSFGPSLPLPLSVRFEGYLAFTGGTFQAGARYEVGFDVGVLSAHGFLSIDVIAQLDPFHLHAELSGGVDVEALGTDFAGVDFHGTLDAPGPVVIAGRVEVSIMGIEAGWNDRFVLGDHDRQPGDPPIENLARHVMDTLTDGSVRGVAAPDPHVRITHPSADQQGRAIVPPLGTVRWTQTVAPLDVDLQRVGGRRLAGPRRLTVSDVTGTATAGVKASFAPALFRDADKAALLALPAFEDLPSGIDVMLEPLHDPGLVSPKDVAYDEVVRGDPPQPAVTTAVVTAALRDRLAARSLGPAVDLALPRHVVHPERWSARVAEGSQADREATTRTQAVLSAAQVRAVGVDAAALPLTEPTQSVSAVWDAP